MKLYWSSRSPYVRKVMVVAHECGLVDRLECQRVVVAAFLPNQDLAGVHPLGKIPTLVLDDGALVYDSRVICEFLDAQQGGTALFPTRWPERLGALRLQALGDGILDLLILRLSELRSRPAEQRSEKLLSALRGKLEAALDVLEADTAELQRSPFSIGHVAIGCALSYMDFRFAGDSWRNGRSSLADWHGSFSSRPSVVATEHVDA